MRILKGFPLVLLILFLCNPLIPQIRISPMDAEKHIGEQATVCGNVASATFASSTRGQPTFLNLEKPYPSQIFTVVIWGRNRSQFGNPETTYKSKNICVTGRIEDYKGVPEIEVREPGQMKLDNSNK